MGTRVCVTGAAGFIGSHLAEHLLKTGHEVTALVRYNSGGSAGWLDTLEKASRSSIEVHYGDVRDPATIVKAVRGAETVFHLAALISIPFSYDAPRMYVETNIAGTMNVLDACRQNGVSHVVHTSTSEVYGTPASVPISEDFPMNAQSPYAATKVGADQLALSYSRSFGLPVTIVRPFNCFGPRQSARAIIPAIITQLAGKVKKLRLGSLSPTRDFTYVDDTVRGFAAAGASRQGVGAVTNLGTGKEISIGNLVSLIAELMGVKAETEEDAMRIRPEESEVQRLCADSGKARERFAWQADYADADGLKRALKLTIDWFQQKENLARYRPGTYQV